MATEPNNKPANQDKPSEDEKAGSKIKIKTDIPLSEKDEVKQAEHRINKNKNK